MPHAVLQDCRADQPQHSGNSYNRLFCILTDRRTAAPSPGCVQRQASTASQLREAMPSPLTPITLQTAACAASTASTASEGLQDGFHTHPGVGQAVTSIANLAEPSRTRIRSIASCHGSGAGALLVSALEGALKVQIGARDPLFCRNLLGMVHAGRTGKSFCCIHFESLTVIGMLIR